MIKRIIKVKLKETWKDGKEENVTFPSPFSWLPLMRGWHACNTHSRVERIRQKGNERQKEPADWLPGFFSHSDTHFTLDRRIIQVFFFVSMYEQPVVQVLQRGLLVSLLLSFPIFFAISQTSTLCLPSRHVLLTDTGSHHKWYGRSNRLIFISNC